MRTIQLHEDQFDTLTRSAMSIAAKDVPNYDLRDVPESVERIELFRNGSRSPREGTMYYLDSFSATEVTYRSLLGRLLTILRT